MIKKKQPKKLRLDSPALGAYGVPPAGETPSVAEAAQQLLDVLNGNYEDSADEDQLDEARFELRKALQQHVRLKTTKPPSNTAGAVEREYITVDVTPEDLAAEDQDFHRILAQAVWALERSGEAAERVTDKVDRVVERMNTDAAPTPIYAAPVDDICMAYGGPPVYRPTERVKRWNQDHDRHPFKETRLVQQLRDHAGLTEEQLDRALDVLDDICTSCWDAAGSCQCWNDR